MTTITSKMLECVRGDLRLGPAEFAERLGLPPADYDLIVRSGITDNIPPRVRQRLESLLLDMETANVEAYRLQLAKSEFGVFSGAKLHHHLDKVAVLQSDPESATPVTVELHLSNLCGHKCPSCTFGIPEQEKSGVGSATFDVSLLPRLISDLKAMGVRAVEVSGGGEPTLHPEAGRVLSELRSAGFDVGLVTNGWFLERPDVRHIELRDTILRCATWCRVSVDAGSQEVYEKTHGRATHINFDKLVGGIRTLARRKLESGSRATLGISFLVSRENYLDLVPAVCLFRDVPGLDYFQVKPFAVLPVERASSPHLVFWDRRLFDTLVALEAYARPGFAIHTAGYKFVDMVVAESRGLPFKKCHGHPFYPTIGADGSVMVCCHMLNNQLDGNGNGVYGRIDAETSFADLWASSRRFEVGAGMDTRLCPVNCKLSETNKILDGVLGDFPTHGNFIR